MCSYNQVIEDRGMERGILIYRTLLETKKYSTDRSKDKRAGK